MYGGYKSPRKEVGSGKGGGKTAQKGGLLQKKKR